MLLTVVTLAASPLVGAEPNDRHVVILLDAAATPLEQFAASELQRYVVELFAVPVAINSTGNPQHTVFRLQVLQDLDPQEIILRPAENGFLVAGGSPVAVLWAVYELVERWGVRYVLYEDVFTAQPGPMVLPSSEVRLRPNMRTRCWRLVNCLADGPVSWSLEENKRFLRQIAKMKYNRIFISFYPAQPFVHYTYQGMEKPAPAFNFGEHYPINENTVGREHFGEMTEFSNPDLVGVNSPQELTERATALAQGILVEAKRLGMETGLGIQPFEWPKEFMAVMPGSEPVKQLGNLTAGPGNEQSMDDPLLREMVATIFRAYAETYPDADYIHVSMPEHRGWTAQAETAYAMLDRKYGLAELGTYEELCAHARARTTFPGGGERVEAMLKGDLSSLAFFDSLVVEKNLLARSGGRPDAKLVYSGVVAEVFPLLKKMMPPGGEVLNFIDYTASRQLKQRALLRQSPPKELRSNLIFTLADDNVGVLPQLPTNSLHEILQEIRASGWSGFYTRYWTVGDLLPAIHYLAKASWDTSVTPKSAYTDLIVHTAGEHAVQPALEAFSLVEEITKGLDDYGLGFAFPVPSMMTKHYDAGGLSDPIRADHKRYRQALRLMKTAHATSAPGGRAFLGYLVARLQFAVRYLDAAEAFGATNRAQKADDTTEAVCQIDEAYTAMRDALQTWADAAEDHGDLGAVALMNKYCYQPICDKRTKLHALLADHEAASPSHAP